MSRVWRRGNKTMSYILDALKRADNERERERGAVPGLHSQQVIPPTTSPDDSDSRAWLWLAGAALAIVLGGLAWYQFGPAIQITSRTTPLPPPPPVPAPLPAPTITAITAVPSTEATPANTAVSAPPTTASAEAPAPVAAKTTPTPSPAAAEPSRQSVAAQARAARRAAQANEAAARAPAPVAASAQPEAAPPPATPVERIYAFNDLPANIRAEIPPVVIGGSSYSPNPKFRLLMVNGQMYQEREKPLPNLVLEQINPKSAVLNYKGYRYRISY